MLNAPQPNPEDLPSPAQLRRSTFVAIAVAAVLGIAVVLPAEYGIDPTGLGGPTGLREMGEIKEQLHHEAEQDGQHSERRLEQRGIADAIVGLLVRSAHAQTSGAAPEWTDEATFTLAPSEGFEIKLSMRQGGVAHYAWTADGGKMNYDLHAHAGGQDARYKRSRGAEGDSGSFTAAFDGDHGWFFRNRDRQPVTVTLRVRGDYSAIKRSD